MWNFTQPEHISSLFSHVGVFEVLATLERGQKVAKTRVPPSRRQKERLRDLQKFSPVLLFSLGPYLSNKAVQQDIKPEKLEEAKSYGQELLKGPPRIHGK